MKIVFATANAGKLREAAEVLGPDFEIVSLAQAGITEEIPEIATNKKCSFDANKTMDIKNWLFSRDPVH